MTWISVWGRWGTRVIRNRGTVERWRSGLGGVGEGRTVGKVRKPRSGFVAPGVDDGGAR